MQIFQIKNKFKLIKEIDFWCQNKMFMNKMHLMKWTTTQKYCSLLKVFSQRPLNHRFLEEQELIRMMTMESRQQVRNKVVQVIDLDQLAYQIIQVEGLLLCHKRFSILSKIISKLIITSFKILKVLYLLIKTKWNKTKDM